MELSNTEDDSVELDRPEELARPDHLEIAISSDQSSLEINERIIGATVQAILNDHDVSQGMISIAVVDNETIHRLNREYLSHDYATDVLSFLLDDQPEWIEGEVIVSAEMATEESKRIGWDSNVELLLYVIHGTLHIVGYDDHAPKDRLAMRRQERLYLLQAGVAAAAVEGRLPDGECDSIANEQSASSVPLNSQQDESEPS